MNEAQRDIALFRYSLIREAADESLTVHQRGRLVRELAGRDHVGPNGRHVRVARGRWTAGSAPIAAAGSKRWRLRLEPASP